MQSQINIANERNNPKIGRMKAIPSLVCSVLAMVAFSRALSAAESPIFPALKDALVVSEGKELMMTVRLPRRNIMPSTTPHPGARHAALLRRIL
jgi:hypothetical protein